MLSILISKIMKLLSFVSPLEMRSCKSKRKSMVNKSSAHARETVLCEGSNEVGMAKVLRVYERSGLLIETIGLCLGQQELECESRKVIR